MFSRPTHFRVFCFVALIIQSVALLHCQLVDNKIQGDYGDTGSGQAPTFSLSALNVPQGVNNITSLNIAVIGDVFNGYQYKIGVSNSTDCHLANGYSAGRDFGVQISDDISPLDDYYIVLCLIGRFADSGLWQEHSQATRLLWGKDTGQPQQVSMGLSEIVLNENDSVGSFSFHLSAPRINDITITYTIGGTSLAGTDHNLTSGTIIIPSGDILNSVEFDLIDDGSLNKNLTIFIGISSVSIPSNSVTLAANSVQRIIIIDDEGPGPEPYEQMSLGEYHTCGIVKTSGVLKCWGKNFSGALGDGSVVDKLRPTVIDAGTSYKSVALGADFSCGLTKTTSSLKCWGRNNSGQLGNGTTLSELSPVSIDPGVSYESIALGSRHACGIITGTGVLKCWGRNFSGQVGDGTNTNKLVPTVIDGGSAYGHVAAGLYHTCGILKVSELIKCWGINYSGQVGDNSYANKNIPTFISDVGTLYSKIDLGEDFSCGIQKITKALKCWGDGGSGQLGNPDIADSPIPVYVDLGAAYDHIFLGAYHLCGILSPSGLSKCWGNGSDGILGDGTFESRLRPEFNTWETEYESFALGSYHSCGIVKDTAILECWGDNSRGQLGDGGSSISSSPNVTDLGSSYILTALGDDHSCGLDPIGVLKCWGDNASGQLGDGTKISRPTPQLIDAGVFYESISLGDNHTCAIEKTTDILKCWGSNGDGQLGDGTTSGRIIPEVTDSGTLYESVATGYRHTCGIVKATGVLKCWGFNFNGQLGDGSTTGRTTPLVIDSGTSYDSIALGYRHTCGIVRTTGVVKCWGRNFQGELGDGTNTDSDSPVLIASGNAFESIALGESFSCGIVRTTGKLFCWGNNGSGSLGDGSTTNRPSPTAINAGVNYSSISLGSSSSCGIVAVSGELNCWGYNNYGQLGSSNTTPTLLPITIDAGTSYNHIAIGLTHGCGITTGTGQLKCWGKTTAGKLGSLDSLHLFPQIVLP